MTGNQIIFERIPTNTRKLTLSFRSDYSIYVRSFDFTVLNCNDVRRYLLDLFFDYLPNSKAKLDCSPVFQFNYSSLPEIEFDIRCIPEIIEVISKTVFLVYNTSLSKTQLIDNAFRKFLATFDDKLLSILNTSAPLSSIFNYPGQLNLIWPSQIPKK